MTAKINHLSRTLIMRQEYQLSSIKFKWEKDFIFLVYHKWVKGNDTKACFLLQVYLQTHFIGKYVLFKSRMTIIEWPINKYSQLN